MWFYRKILRAFWIDRANNTVILLIIHNELEVLFKNKHKLESFRLKKCEI